MFEGKENITVFNSSAWGERAFCKECGTGLYLRVKQNNQHIVSPGLFDDDSGFELDHQIFIDRKPAYYDFKNETTKMTEAEFFAKFA